MDFHQVNSYYICINVIDLNKSIIFGPHFICIASANFDPSIFLLVKIFCVSFQVSSQIYEHLHVPYHILCKHQIVIRLVLIISGQG